MLPFAAAFKTPATAKPARNASSEAMFTRVFGSEEEPHGLKSVCENSVSESQGSGKAFGFHERKGTASAVP
jgi:hypothetical protein